MQLIYADEGLLPILKLLADNAGNGLTWALFTNDITPSRSSVLTDFALAAWSTTNLPNADFTLRQVAAHVGSVQAPTVVLTNSTGAAVSIYGYVVYDAAISTKLFASVRLDVAPAVVNPGATFSLIPVLGDQSIAS